MINIADHFTDNVKMIMLQNAVSGVSAPHHVKTHAAHDVAHGKPPLDYVNYQTLLLSAATVEDEKHSFSRPRPQRTVQLHDQQSILPEESSTFDIDTNVGNLEVNSTARNMNPPKKSFRPSMTRDQWNSLSTEEKVIWDSFSPQTKATILGFKKSSSPTPPPKKVNLHDISAADYFCMLHSQAPHEDSVDNNSTFSNTSDQEYFDTNSEDIDSSTPAPEHPSLLLPSNPCLLVI